jgi:hypothetical protein
MELNQKKEFVHFEVNFESRKKKMYFYNIAENDQKYVVELILKKEKESWLKMKKTNFDHSLMKKFNKKEEILKYFWNEIFQKFVLCT